MVHTKPEMNNITILHNVVMPVNLQQPAFS